MDGAGLGPGLPYHRRTGKEERRKVPIQLEVMMRRTLRELSGIARLWSIHSTTPPKSLSSFLVSELFPDLPLFNWQMVSQLLLPPGEDLLPLPPVPNHSLPSANLCLRPYPRLPLHLRLSSSSRIVSNHTHPIDPPSTTRRLTLLPSAPSQPLQSLNAPFFALLPP